MKNYKVEISIIMPLYNAGKFLAETLESVQRQIFLNYELICINDASDDNTFAILQEFKKKDSRIIIVENEKRLGAGPSRNKGIEMAKGKYLVFLDGDDIFDEEMLRLEYECAEAYNTDVVVCERMHVPSETIYEKRSVQRKSVFIEKCCKNTFKLSDVSFETYLSLGFAPANKMYRREYISSLKLVFQDLSCCNDLYFVGMAFFMASKIRMLDDRRIMVYARNHSTSSRISYYREPMCYYWAMKKIGDELKEKNILLKFINYYYGEVYFLFCAILNTCSDESAKKRFYSFLQQQGINNLLEISEESSIIINPVLRKFLDNFIKLSCESEWYKEGAMLFALALEENKEKIVALLKLHIDNKYNIVLWGAGKNGNIFIEFLENNEIRIAGVIDQNIKKVGSVLRGYTVMAPEELLKENSIILFTSDKVYDEMRGKLENKYYLINIKDMVV